MRAVGYHGTSVERAERILAEGFRLSRNDYDWLGDGAYFFQDSHPRAAEWAYERFGDEAAVLGAEIDLDGCVDLLDPRSHRAVQAAFEELSAILAKAGLRLPRQTAGAHRLDREVINHAAAVVQKQGVQVRSVRAAFVEGEPLYAGSAFFSKAHVQIAVRDIGAIASLWRAASK